jgi:hypothetical protein
MSSPRIISADDLALEFRDVFGPLGPARRVTGHFSAGPRAGDWRLAGDVARRLHVEHLDRGWGGCGYHYLVADDGTLLCLRPAGLQGAHVGGHNGGNVGVLCAGTSGHRPTRAQRTTYGWLLAHAHTEALPEGHRTAEDLRSARTLVHHLWHGHSTNPCAGWFEDMFLAGVDQPREGETLDPVDHSRPIARAYPPASEIRGIVADGCHVSVLEAHRAAACRDRDARAEADREEVLRPGAGRLAFAFEPPF